MVLDSDSRHNLKYWTRKPYLGFGVDAHSMLIANEELRAEGVQTVRFATPDALEGYSAAANELDPVAARATQLRASRTLVDAEAALEEALFLGLRLNRGVSLSELTSQFGGGAVSDYQLVMDELVTDGLLHPTGERLHLSTRGRLLSNEVFARFLHDRTINPKEAHTRG